MDSESFLIWISERLLPGLFAVEGDFIGDFTV